ncbi:MULTISPECIES: glycosyltransferase [Pedobacter]|uniref:glycosyltransferase n=1 Tax=Pedobacter TaxID=84567 RepID=UPI001E55FBC6|nr:MULTISPECIES: glycosyltransferase [Pedobacter]
MKKPTIFYFVHAHGNGHMATFNMLLPALSVFFDVIAVTTNATITNCLKNVHQVAVLELPPKYPIDYEIPEHTFSQAFEVTPYKEEAANRARALADAIIHYRPKVFYCDGVPELAIMVRGMGVPVVLVHLPGNISNDPTQVFAHELADHIIAHFPQILEQPDYRYSAKTFYSGYLSKYAIREIQHVIPSNIQKITIILGSDNYDQKVIKKITHNPDTNFTIIGNKRHYDLGENCNQLGIIEDISQATTGDIVISAAGQNTIAELLSLNKRLILLPESRPYNEQAVHADMLFNNQIAFLAREDFNAEQWKVTIEKAKAFRPISKNLVNASAAADIAQKMNEWYGI